MGGALITIKDVHTGEVLAQGRTAGGTGDTTRIMKTPVVRIPVQAGHRFHSIPATRSTPFRPPIPFHSGH
jgi:hypothetical protein